MPNWVTVVLNEDGTINAVVIPEHGDAGLQVVRDPEDGTLGPRQEEFYSYSRERDRRVPGYGWSGHAVWEQEDLTEWAARPAPAPRFRTPREQVARRGRPPGSGRRRDQALTLLRAAPAGLLVAELADQMGIKPNYLYRILPPLKEEGLVHGPSNGRRWYAVPEAE